MFGWVSIQADLEGVNPEVTVTLTVPNDSPPLDNLMVHPCVQGGDTRLLESGMKLDTVVSLKAVDTIGNDSK